MKLPCKLNFLILLLLSSCAVKKQIPMRKEINKINAWSCKNIQNSLYPQQYPTGMLQNLSLINALEIALKNNQKFLGSLQEIGIKSSDLTQIGFFSNPKIETIFHFPKPGERTNIEFDAQFAISDLWQVPLRKKVAESELKIKSSDILEKILLLKKDVTISFYTCIFEKMRLRLLQNMVTALISLEKHLTYRYQFGYATQLDLHIIQAAVAQYQAKTCAQRGILNTAIYSLQYLLNLSTEQLCIDIQNTMFIPPVLSTQDHLLKLALQSHPLILLNEIQIQKARQTIRYEKSRMIDTVHAGIAYKREFESSAGVGPYFSFDLPIFNTNYGNIERAKYELEQAEYEYQNSINVIRQSLCSNLAQYCSYYKAITLYQKDVIPSLKKAIAFAQEQMHLMLIPSPMVIEVKIKYLNAIEELLHYTQKASMTYAELEYAIGKPLEAKTNYIQASSCNNQ